jgi:hypothetical protein
MDNHHELGEERPPKNTVVANVKACDSERHHLPAIVVPGPQDNSRSMRPMGVDDCPRITPGKVSCIGVRSAKLRLISMNVFLIMRFSEAPLSTRVFATLCRLIGRLITKGKF